MAAMQGDYYCGGGIFNELRNSSKGYSTYRGSVKGGQGLPTFGKTKRSTFSTNAQSRFVSVVLDGVLGPPFLARHT